MFGRSSSVALILLVSFPNLASLAAEDNRPETVHRYCHVVRSRDWYQEQERLWRSVISKDPKDERAWYNYFFAARYGYSGTNGRTPSREMLMDSIYVQMGKAIPQSWVYHYIHYYNYGTDFSRLERAYAINPQAADLYWEFIKEYELAGKKEEKREFCERLYDSKDIATGILNLNYNMLNSTEFNSILFTNGDNDTYPAWVLQEVKDIRDDVLILNVHAIFGDRNYLDVKLEEREMYMNINDLSTADIPLFLQNLVLKIRGSDPEVPIHVSQTVHTDYYQHFKESLYLTGLVYTFSEVPFPHETVHMDIMENKLRLDYLNYDWYGDLHRSETLVRRLNLNYIEPFLKASRWSRSMNDVESSERLKQKALILAMKANDEELIRRIENSDW